MVRLWQVFSAICAAFWFTDTRNTVVLMQFSSSNQKVVVGTCRAEQQQYRVDVSDGKTTANVKCLFSRTQDLLYVLLPREVRPLTRSSCIMTCPEPCLDPRVMD